MARYYADTGINWEVIYEVILEEEDILVLRDLGRFHRFDKERMWTKPTDGYVEVGYDGFARVDNIRKLVEVQE